MTILQANSSSIAHAATALRAGRLVALPTETVYGLAADATNVSAVAKIFTAKGRPRFNPLIAHVDTLESARKHGRFHDKAVALAQTFWPGPLTLVVPRQAHSPICDLACAGLASVGLRAPSHPIAQALIKATGAPLAAPSANRSGHVSPTTAAHVEADLGASVECILDAGPCGVGVESTIVAIDLDGAATLLRIGAVTRAQVVALIGALADARPGDIAAPGMLSSHYAPRAALRLNAANAAPGETYLGFGDAGGATEANLSRSGDLLEAAANLYATLRALDASGASAIAVAPIPSHGLGEAINDRLTRAAAPR